MTGERERSIRPTDPETLLTSADKGLPARAAGMSIRSFLATTPTLDELWTPLLVLDDSGIEHNLRTMAGWTSARGLELMPHGKTTMAPTLWRRQEDAGALGITLATPGQVRAARSVGAGSIQLANEIVDPRAARWLAGELADPSFRVVSWVDSVRGVELLESGLAEAPRRLDVVVELGAPDARTGVRTVAEGVRLAERIAATPAVRLAGVACYEGSVAHGGRSDEEIRAVADLLARQVELHGELAGLYEPGDVYVTAGGSAYFDLVAEAYAGAGAGAGADAGAGAGAGSGAGVGPDAVRPDGIRTRFVLRSGAYVVHDDGFYRQVSPFDEARESADAPRLVPAMHGFARVLSHPEERLSLLDGGKRDLPYDEGMPIPRGQAPDLAGPWSPLSASVERLNDQHAYLRTDGDAPVPGSVVRLGLSHPCTAFDKWRLVPVVDSLESGRVVDLVGTLF